MSGHNRWSKIKHKKEASDAKKSKLWTKVIKEITVSARLGGGDINGNPRLRSAVDKGFDRPLLHTVRGAGYVLRDGG